MGVLFFAENFVGSMFIGSTIGVLSALLFKHVRITVGCLLCRAGGDAMPW
jgi:disulfide bond formation protein DsbB